MCISSLINIMKPIKLLHTIWSEVEAPHSINQKSHSHIFLDKAISKMNNLKPFFCFIFSLNEFLFSSSILRFIKSPCLVVFCTMSILITIKKKCYLLYGNIYLVFFMTILLLWFWFWFWFLSLFFIHCFPLKGCLYFTINAQST